MTRTSRARQLSFFPAPALEHGGTTRVGKRKIMRPFDPARSLHLVLRSGRARGALSFLHRHNRSRFEALFHTSAKSFEIRVYRFANVGNHIHALIKAPNRSALHGFLRAFNGTAARLITGAKKGLAHGRFWDAPAYTRVVQWGRHYAATLAYLAKNRLEAIGFGGARLRLGANGAAVVVFGDPEDLGPELAAVLEKRIRGP